MAESSPDNAIAHSETGLSPRQIAFFRQYGYLKIPGLFNAEEMAEFETGFEAVFQEHLQAQNEGLMHIKNSPLHVADQPETRKERFLIPGVTEYSARLIKLPEDPRIIGIVESLLGEDYIFRGSDGSIFNCSTSWHYDFFNDPFEKTSLKLSLYLDPLHHDSGAIRFMPGTNADNEYTRNLRRVFNFRGDETPEEVFGIKPEDAPSVTVETQPGDLVLWDYLTMHATFHGNVRRRQIGLNFTQT